MDKQPVGQLPDLTQSNNDDEIMVITNSEYNQLKKEKISDFITDLTSTDENNAIVKGTDGKMFVTDFGNASNITEGTLPASVLPEIPLEKIPDIPKDKLPQIETADLPNSGVTAGEYIYPTNMQVNSKGQIVSVENGVTADITKEQIDIVTARPLSDNAYTQEQYPDEYSYWVDQAHSTFDLSKFDVVGSPTISEDGIASGFSSENYLSTNSNLNIPTADTWEIILPTLIFKSVSQYIIAADVQYSFTFAYTSKRTVALYLSSDGSTWDISSQHSSKLFELNTPYKFKLNFDGNSYSVYVLENGIWTSCIKINSNLKIFNFVQLTVGKYHIAYANNTDFNLKSMAVWVDGQPVFSANKTAIDTINGTLEIPYTETTDGTKIVDAAYFDRVQSCREQTGQALYLTLDEQNQQYYLPQGTVSGMISTVSGMISQNKQKSLNKTQITNCILEAPNGVATNNGSTITVKQGLKVLIPNGRNADGTLNNIEYVVDNDITNDSKPWNTNYIVFLDVDNLRIISPMAVNVFTSETIPSDTFGDTRFIYKPSENYWYYALANSSFEKFKGFIVCNFTGVSGTITSLTPYQPVELLKRSDKAQISAWGMPDYTKGINKNWSSTHTAECNGWVYAGMQINHAGYAYRGAFLKIDDSQFIVYSSNVESGGMDNELFLPIRKGSVYKITENGSAEVLQRRLKFYPCISEGV